MGHEVKVPLLEDFYADYYAAAGIALASCLAMPQRLHNLFRGGCFFPRINLAPQGSQNAQYTCNAK